MERELYVIKSSYDIVSRECEELRRNYWIYHKEMFRKHELGFSLKCHVCKIFFSEKLRKAFIEAECPVCLEKKHPVLVTVCGHLICEDCFDRCKP
jgi:hypothetical protein